MVKPLDCGTTERDVETVKGVLSGKQTQSFHISHKLHYFCGPFIYLIEAASSPFLL